MRAGVALVELFVAVLIAGLSAVNAALPIAAWSRTREARFLWIALAAIALLLLGALGAWAELPTASAAVTPIPLYGLVLVLAATLILLISTIWPRRS